MLGIFVFNVLWMSARFSGGWFFRRCIVKLYNYLALVILGFSSLANALSSDVGKGCDKIAPIAYIRYNKSYIFSLKYKNANNYKHWLSDFSINYLADDQFNRGSVPNFDWSPELASNPTILGGDEKKIIQSSTYFVASVPASRDSNPDIFLKYNFINYGDPDFNDKWTNGPTNRTDCQPYIITWCGDGVVDSAREVSDSWTTEVCDDGKNNGKHGYCNTSCQVALP
jgi:hypothetical protein